MMSTVLRMADDQETTFKMRLLSHNVNKVRDVSDEPKL